MFKKVLIANRGEIAVRVIRSCRDLGILTVAIYSETDRDGLHVRLADECMPITSDLRYGDKEEVLAIAKETGADAIHPGYGFLAEEADFAEMCANAGITFIGPSPEVIRRVRTKIGALQDVEAAGYRTPTHSECSFEPGEMEELRAAAADLGYPLVIKSCKGGRGRGERVVQNEADLERIAAEAQREAMMIYGSASMYLEKVIAPSHHVTVQILADQQGNVVHLGEREGSITRHNQKSVEEAPAPCLTQSQREEICAEAVAIARLLGYDNVGAVEFLVDENGAFYFTEMKARIQIEHAVSEVMTRIDLVQEQLRVSEGEALRWKQEEIRVRGCAIQVRINAEDPWNNYLPSPGMLERFRIPGGMHVRVDTYGYVGCTVPVRYDSLLAKVIVWGETREQAITRLRRALEDFKIVGVQTNQPLHLHILNDPAFVAGHYDTSFLWRHKVGASLVNDETKRDLAAAAAVAFFLRNELVRPVIPAERHGGWHRSSRTIPG
jgi:acetyl/propionyl-CoA carboxylase alpha subunit